MKNLILSFLCLWAILANAQQLVSTAGTQQASTNGSVSFSIGEIASGFYTKSNGVASVGYQQVYDTLSISIEEFTFQNLQVAVYPNPTQDFITAQFNTENSNAIYQFSLVNAAGQTVKLGTLQNAQQLALNDLSAGIYLLNFFDPTTNQNKTFRITKK